jgi:hypothetical protein
MSGFQFTASVVEAKRPIYEARGISQHIRAGIHDKRWNSWRWKPILEKRGHLCVLINPDLLKTSAFIVASRGPIGTVFFVDVPLKEIGSEGHAFLGEHPLCGARHNGRPPRIGPKAWLLALSVNCATTGVNW